MGEIGGCGEWDECVRDRFWWLKKSGGGDAVNPLSLELSEMENWRPLRNPDSTQPSNYLA